MLDEHTHTLLPTNFVGIVENLEKNASVSLTLHYFINCFISKYLIERQATDLVVYI